MSELSLVDKLKSKSIDLEITKKEWIENFSNLYINNNFQGMKDLHLAYCDWYYCANHLEIGPNTAVREVNDYLDSLAEITDYYLDKELLLSDKDEFGPVQTFYREAVEYNLEENLRANN